MTKTETHTNKPLLRVLLAAAAVLILCGAAVVGAAAADGPKIIYYANNDTEQTYTQPFTPDTLVELEWEKNMGFTVPKDNGFLGWAVGSTAATAYYTDHQPVSLSDTGDVHLYAQWAPITYLDDDGDITLSESGYYRLSKNIDANIIVKGGKLVVLDLYGHELSGKNDSIHTDPYSTVTIGYNAVLTIKDSTTKGNGKITHGNSGVNIEECGTLSLQSGTLTDNIASSGDVSGGGGGGVFMARDSHFFMIGGSIINNKVRPGERGYGGGGGVCICRGTFIMTGGSISNNGAPYGGGVYVWSDGTFTMTGGEITGNKADNDGGGVYCGFCRFTMTGGSITGNDATYGGGVYYCSPNPFEVSGSSVIKDNHDYDNHLNNVWSDTRPDLIILAGELASDAEVRITSPVGKGTQFGTTSLSAGSGEECFVADGANLIGSIVDGKLVWKPLVWVAEIRETGVRYLSVMRAIEAADANQTVKMLSNSTEDITVSKKITLDLNGHTLRGDGSGSVLRITSGGHLTLRDSGSDGKLTGGKSRYGGGAEVADGGVLILESGTISGNTAEYGGGVFVNYGGTFTIPEGSDGSITGNTAESYGGGVVSQGSFTMSDGRISVNSATYGGGVYVCGFGTFEFTGGTIELNHATDGGGVYSSGAEFLLSNDSIIRQNTADRDGGGIYIDTYGKFSMSGGTVSANTAVNNGGGILILADSTLSGGKIVTNTVQNGSGGGVCVSDGTLTISGGKISGNMVLKSENGGGGVFAEGNGVVTMSGKSGRIISNSAGYGGGVCIYNGGTFTLSEGKIGGEAGYGNTANYGGGIYAENGNLTMTGGAVSYNTAKYGGGGVVFYNGTTDNHAFTMSGGLIDLNTSDVKSPAGDYLGRGVVIDCSEAACPYTFFKMSGSASIPADDVYLYSGLFITVPDVFTTDAAGACNIRLDVEEPHQTLIASANDAEVAESSLPYLKLNDSYTSKGYELKIDHANPTQIISVGSHVTVTFVSNGGSPVPSQSIERGKTAVEPAPPAFAGHEFKGWFTDNGTFEKKYDFKTPVNDNLTLYAKWDAQYHITYNENGSTSGTAPIDGKAYKSGDSATILSPGDLKKTNHHFDSWKTKADGTGDKYTPDQVIAVTGNLQLFAQWKENQLTVTYDPNGATGTAPVDSGKYNVNDWVTVLGPGDLTKEEYHFNGWQVAGDINRYGEGSTYQIKTSVTFTAVWDSVETYSLAYNANGATSGSVPETKEYAEGDSVTIDNNSGNLEKTGYSFKKDSSGNVLWSTSSGSGGQEYAGNTSLSMPGQDLALYAQWVPHTYTITYNSNFSTESTETVDRAYDDGKGLKDGSEYSRSGYTFSGWNTKTDGSGTWYNAGYTGNLTSEQGANITLYAQWTAGTHSVTFHSNGGIFDKTAGSTVKTVSCTIGQQFETYFPQIVSREGYTFEGWYTETESGDKVEGSTPVLSTSPSSLYAHWTPITYTIEFRAGGGTGEMDTMSCVYGTKYDLHANTFSYAYHRFAGWSQPGKTKLLHDKAEVENLTTKSEDIVILTAVWDAELYTVTFYRGAGDVYLTTYVPYGSLINKPSDPEKPGYEFSGWYTATSGGTQWDFSKDPMPPANLNLYAEWTPTDMYSITIPQSPGGAVTATPASASAGTLIQLTVTPEPGYQLTGWDVEPETVEIRDDLTFIMPDQDVSLYGLFARNSSPGQGSSTWITEPLTPTLTPTPTAGPTPAIPTVKPTAEQTPSGSTPAPFAGILAGLGAAAAVFGLRRK